MIADTNGRLQIAVIEYEDLLDSQEREMFSRVQMGVPLSPAEKLGAVKGPWGDYFRELVKRFFDEKDANLQHIAKLDRGKDFQLMAQICLYVIHYAQDRYTPLSGIIATFLKVSHTLVICACQALTLALLRRIWATLCRSSRSAKRSARR